MIYLSFFLPPMSVSRASKIPIIIVIAVVALLAFLQIIFFFDISNFSGLELQSSFNGSSFTTVELERQQQLMGWNGTTQEFIDAKMISWFEFAQERKCALSDSFYSRIYSDLQPFVDGFNSSLLEKAEELDSVDVVKVVNGSVVENGDAFSLIHSFASLLPDLSFIVNRLDEPRVLKNDPMSNSDFALIAKDYGFNEKTSSFGGNPDGVAALLKASCDPNFNVSYVENLHAFFLGPASFSVTSKRLPIFSFSTIDGCFDDIVIPVHYFYSQSPAVPEGIPSDWNQKKDILHWRGSSTGGTARTDNDNWKGFHRQRMVHQFGPLSNHSEDVDIAFTQIWQTFGFEYFGDAQRRTSSQAKFFFKYILDMDGSVSTERFLALLRFDMLVFKSTIFRDWVLDRVEPWVHYIPISLDYSDLIQKFNWAKGNQMASNTIVLNAKQHAEKRLRKVDMECYSFRLLLEYARLLKKN